MFQRVSVQYNYV